MTNKADNRVRRKYGDIPTIPCEWDPYRKDLAQKGSLHAAVKIANYRVFLSMDDDPILVCSGCIKTVEFKRAYFIEKLPPIGEKQYIECINGHPMDQYNAYRKPDPSTGSGTIYCRECKAEAERRIKLRKFRGEIGK